MAGSWTGWIAWIVLAAVISVASCQALFPAAVAIEVAR